MGESFRYLGRFFDFNMSKSQHMSELSSLVQDLMNDIDLKPLHPKHKVLLYSRYVLSTLSWQFTIANISKTWKKEHLDSVVNGYIRKWLDIPISGDLWKSSSCHTNIQYDVYKSTKEVLKDFRSNQEDKLQHHLTSQGFFFSSVIKYSLSSSHCKFYLVRGPVSSTQEHLQFYHPLHQQLPPYT